MVARAQEPDYLVADPLPWSKWPHLFVPSFTYLVNGNTDCADLRLLLDNMDEQDILSQNTTACYCSAPASS